MFLSAKKVKFSALFAVSALLLLTTSCEKDLSPDEPFPDQREASIYITPSSEKLYALDPETGKRQWEISLGSNSVGSPVIMGTDLYVATEGRKLVIIDLLTKTERARVNMSGGGDPGAIALATDGRHVFTGADRLYAYDLNGIQLWSYDAGSNISSAPTIKNNRVYVAAGDRVHCVDTAGVAIWTSNAVSGGEIKSGVNVTDGSVFYGAEDGIVYAINESDGSDVWKYTTAGAVNSSPMVYGGMVIVGSDDNFIYNLDVLPDGSGNGQLRWKVGTGERVRSSAAVHEFSNTVYIGCHDYNVYALNHVTGDTRYEYAAGSLVNTSPIVTDEYAYFASYDKYFYCIRVSDGVTVWKSNLDNICVSSPVLDLVDEVHYSGISGMSLR